MRRAKDGLCERLITRFLTATHFTLKPRNEDMHEFPLAPRCSPFNLCVLFCKEGLISVGHCKGDTQSLVFLFQSAPSDFGRTLFTLRMKLKWRVNVGVAGMYLSQFKQFCCCDKKLFRGRIFNAGQNLTGGLSRAQESPEITTQKQRLHAPNCLVLKVTLDSEP